MQQYQLKQQDKGIFTSMFLRHLTKLSTLFLIANLLLVCTSFIIATKKGYRKCFYADVSHEKTLDVRFGFPRKQPHNCVFKMEIDYIAEKEDRGEDYNYQTKQEDVSLYSGMFYCYQMSPREPFVYKHTPSDTEYSGQYRICISNLQDFNTPQQNNTMFELQIIQKFDPTLMADMFNVPLVGSSQLMDLQQNVVEIKRILSWCQVHVKEAQKLGDTLANVLAMASDTNYRLTYLQLIFLAVYGVVWVVVVFGVVK